MKTKLIHSNYDKETGISTATVANKYGEFTEFSFLREEDKDIVSSYAGCRYAEMKAIRKSIRAERKEKKAQLTILKRMYNELTFISDFEPNSKTIRRIKKYIYTLEKEITSLNEKEEEVTKELLTFMASRDKIVRKIQKDKDNKLSK